MEEATLPTLSHALRRLALRPVEVRSMVSLGAGRGRDMAAFRKIWPEADILLVDMDPRFEPGYREMQAQMPGVSYEICGAAAEDREGYLYKKDEYGGAIVSDPSGREEDLTPTRFRRLDSLARDHRLEPPFFLKLDTHGAEIEVLAGGEAVLEQTSLVMMEVYNFKLRHMEWRNLTFDEMIAHMRGLGFRVVDICDPLFRPGDSALWQMHLIFARADHPTFRRSSYAAPKG